MRAQHGRAREQPETAAQQRLRAVIETGLRAEPDESFDRFARMVRAQLRVPVALVSLVDDRRQFFPGAVGLAEPWAAFRETPLSHSFCRHVVATGAPLIVTDARLDDRVSDNLAIPDLGVVAYAGMPLTDAGGAVMGSLCAIDGQPREWSQQDLDTLRDLAAACSSELRLRILAGHAEAGRREAEQVRAGAEAATTRLRLQAEITASLASTLDVDEALRRFAALVVPRVADWGVASRLDGDIVTRVAVVDRRSGRPSPAPVLPPIRLLSTDRGAVARLYRGFDSLRVVTAAEVADDDTLAGALQNAMEALGGQHAIVVAIRSSREVFGAVTLVRLDRDRPFEDEDRTLVVELADRAALALENARLYERVARASETLQRSLLTRLPEPDGLQLVARYLPAAQEAQVGGDWYDAFQQPNGGTVLVIGDVVGHDMSAAAAMGQLRNLLRGIAYAGDDTPARVLSRVDQAIDGLRLGSLATALVADLSPGPTPGTQVLRWSNAGHPPPMVLRPDGTVDVLEPEEDLLLGLDPDGKRADHEVLLERDSTLLLYTDGLVERREYPLEHGLARLRRALAALAGVPLERFCGDLLARLVPAEPDDDVAIVVARLL